MPEQLIDFKQALKRLGGDEEFLNELLAELITQVDDSFEDLKQAIANKDYLNLKNLSHSLKGASANLNVSRMASHFLELEDLGLENKTDGANDLLSLVTEDRNELEEFLNRSGMKS